MALEEQGTSEARPHAGDGPHASDRPLAPSRGSAPTASSVAAPTATAEGPDCVARDESGGRGAEIHELLGRLRRARLRPPTPAGLTDAEANALMAAHLAAHHGCELRPGTIARFAHVTPSALSQTLGSLERKGYILRTRDEGDSRSVVVSTTDLGEAALAEMREGMARYRADFFAYLGEEDADRLIAILRRVVAYVERNASR